MLILLASIARAQDSRSTALASVYRQYQALGGRHDVGTLVRLDQQLRRLVPYWRWEGPMLGVKDYVPSYEKIGVQPLLFESGTLGYSGKLLREAHAINPRSHREFTLYATLFGPEGEVGNAPPIPQAAKTYLHEFPNGPFSFQAHLALGNFQSDLFQVLQGPELRDRNGYKYKCYRTYLTKAPLPVQRRQAQSSAVEHYRALTRLRPDVHEFADWLKEAQRGRIEGWHYCAD